jgi:hypothetical protein
LKSCQIFASRFSLRRLLLHRCRIPGTFLTDDNLILMKKFLKHIKIKNFKSLKNIFVIDKTGEAGLVTAIFICDFL